MRVCTEHKSDLLFMKERFTLFMSGKTKNLTNKFILHFFSFAFIKTKQKRVNHSLQKEQKERFALFCHKKTELFIRKTKERNPNPAVHWAKNNLNLSIKKPRN